MDTEDDLLLELTVEVVSAYAGNNPIPAGQLPEVIQTVHQSLKNLTQEVPEKSEKVSPAVSIRRSVRDDAIICLECGTEHKMIKRHLKTAHSMTVTDYREKWNLKPDYPLVAPSYAKQRSQLARQFGLGKKD